MPLKIEWQPDGCLLYTSTPIEFIRVIRLKRAAQLLRESQLHVSEVAFEAVSYTHLDVYKRQE